MLKIAFFFFLSTDSPHLMNFFFHLNDGGKAIYIQEKYQFIIIWNAEWQNSESFSICWFILQMPALPVLGQAEDKIQSST